MKLSKQYITEKLQTMTVNELAVKLAEDLHKKYEEDGTLQKYAEAGLHVDYEATVRKFENMIRPYAPVKATDVMREFGVKVVEVK